MANAQPKPRRPVPRVPLAPVFPHLDAIAFDRSTEAGRPSVLADLAGCSTGQANVYLRAGEIPEHRADRLAAALALHPLNIWPTEWAALTEGAPTP